jgi:hypothetical protein
MLNSVEILYAYLKLNELFMHSNNSMLEMLCVVLWIFFLGLFIYGSFIEIKENILCEVYWNNHLNERTLKFKFIVVILAVKLTVQKTIFL